MLPSPGEPPSVPPFAPLDICQTKKLAAQMGGRKGGPTCGIIPLRAPMHGVFVIKLSPLFSPSPAKRESGGKEHR
jgi:hypothetical protein